MKNDDSYVFEKDQGDSNLKIILTSGDKVSERRFRKDMKSLLNKRSLNDREISDPYSLGIIEMDAQFCKKDGKRFYDLNPIYSNAHLQMYADKREPRLIQSSESELHIRDKRNYITISLRSSDEQ